jgi:hypothetical protein
MMGNKATNGPFAPLVRLTRSVMGSKDFNKFRGQAISLHSQVWRQHVYSCDHCVPAHPLIVPLQPALQGSTWAQFSVNVQIIKDFCGTIGADVKQAQAVIRLAKKNGEWLGFLS